MHSVPKNVKQYYTCRKEVPDIQHLYDEFKVLIFYLHTLIFCYFIFQLHYILEANIVVSTHYTYSINVITSYAFLNQLLSLKKGLILIFSWDKNCSTHSIRYIHTMGCLVFFFFFGLILIIRNLGCLKIIFGKDIHLK